MVRVSEILLAGGGWVLSLTLMIDGSIDSIPAMQRWAIQAALVAWIPTLCLILQHHRKVERAILKRHRARERDAMMRDLIGRIRAEGRRQEELVQAVAVEFAQAELPRIRQS